MEFIPYAWSHKIIVVSLAPKTSGKTQPLDVAVFFDYQKAYGRAADEEVRGGVNITKRDFTRSVFFPKSIVKAELTSLSSILPKAREAAFTRTNIVHGFEQPSIYPFNHNTFDFMRTYYEEQQAQNRHDSCAPETDRNSPSPPPSPSPQPAELAMNQWDALMRSPPATPTKLMEAGHEMRSQLMCQRARSAILSERIRELQGTEQGRSKTADRRRPPGKSRFFDIDTLKEMLEERDAKDREAAERRLCGHGRGRGRGRGRGSRGCGSTRGRGRGRTVATGGDESSGDDWEGEEPESEERDELSPAEDQLPTELLEGFDNEPPVFAYDSNESEKENCPESTGGKRAGTDGDLGAGRRRSKRVRHV